jgi:hypothetical protein
MSFLRRHAWAGAASLLMAAMLVITASAQKSKDKDSKEPDPRPQVKLKAQPVIAMAPARVVFTAELVGGANDFEEYYCTGVEWNGDGFKSESSRLRAMSPKSEISAATPWACSPGHRVMFHLKRHDKAVGNATISDPAPASATGSQKNRRDRKASFKNFRGLGGLRGSSLSWRRRDGFPDPDT